MTDASEPVVITAADVQHLAGLARIALTREEIEHLAGELTVIVDSVAKVREVATPDVPATSQLTVTYLRPGKPGPLEVTAQLRTQGEHLTVCDADVEQDGRGLVHAVATFAVLHR